MTKEEKFQQIQKEARNIASRWGLPKDTFHILWDEEAPKELKKKSQDAQWLGLLENNVISLNARLVPVNEVRPIICHEMAHLVYNEPKVKAGLDHLWTLLTKKEKEALKHEIKVVYPGNEKREELRVRTLEIFSRDSKKGGALERFFEAIQKAWESFLAKITGKTRNPLEDPTSATPKEIVDAVLELGIKKLLSLDQKQKKKQTSSPTIS